MTLKKTSTIWIPSIAEIIFLAVFMFLSFCHGRALLNDADTGYHIRAGEYILRTLSIPRHDIFSFHTPPIPWTAHEWLSEVIMALLHGRFGLTGVVLFFSFLIALTYFLLFCWLRSREGNIFIAVALTILAFGSSQIHWLARPHIFSLMIMIVWCRILDRYQYEGENRLYLLPLLMVPWVNLHGGYITGFLLLGCYAAGNFVQSFFSTPSDRETARRKCRVFLTSSFFCLVVSLVNPIGFKILLFPFNLVNNRFLMDHVSEFLSPNFHEPLMFKYLLLLAIVVPACSRIRPTAVELVQMLVFTNMALYSIRYVTLFAIVFAPILLRRCDDLLEEARGVMVESFRVRSARIAAVDATARGWLWLTVGMAVVVMSAAGGTIGYSFDEKLKPVAAVEFLRKERISGNMFDNDEFGDYIIYAAWPEYRVFFDGRSDMYGTERMKEYFRIAGFESGWERVIEKYRIDWFIIEAASPLSRYLAAVGGWKLVYADRVAHIVVKDIPRYRKLIARYRDVRPVRQTNGAGGNRGDGT